MAQQSRGAGGSFSWSSSCADEDSGQEEKIDTPCGSFYANSSNKAFI